MQFVLVDSQVVESYVKVAAVHALIAALSLRFCRLCAGCEASEDLGSS